MSKRLEGNLTTVTYKARERTLPDVTLTDRHPHIALLRKNTPESAEAVAESICADVVRQNHRAAAERMRSTASPWPITEEEAQHFLRMRSSFALAVVVKSEDW